MLSGLYKKLAEPCGPIRSKRKNLPIAILCHENKPVVVVEKLGLIAVWKNFQDIFETMRKSGLDILDGDIVPTAFYAVSDSPNAFFGSV